MHESSVAKKCSVLVPSCDAYSDLWKPFLALFFRYWSDCPFEVFLGSNEKKAAHPRVSTICAGGGENWTNRVREQIEAIETPYVLLILEDFFLRSPVSTERAVWALETLEKLNGRLMRLVKRPGPGPAVSGFPGVGVFEAGCPYRVSTQASYWRKEALLSLMRRDESIWQFELLGSRRSDNLEGFFGVKENIVTYKHHVVERGKWFPHEAMRFSRMDIGVDLRARPVMDGVEFAQWSARKAVSVALDVLPWRTRNWVVARLKAAQKRMLG